MATRSLILTSTAAGTGKKLQKTITDVNPEATSAQLKTFAQKINALTTNSYVQTDCIDKCNVDTETALDSSTIDTRQTPALSLATVPSLAEINSDTTTSHLHGIRYDGDGLVYAYRKSGCLYLAIALYSNNQIYFNKAGASLAATAGTIVLGATGGENYKPIEVEYTIE